MEKYKRFGLLLYAVFAGILSTHASHINPKLLKEQWPARWIAHPKLSEQEFAVVHFRKEVDIAKVPDSLVVHVSGDSRYKLYVNGQWVGHGPAAGDLRNWQFESINIEPYLKEGRNVIASEVWNFASQRPMAHMSMETGFILQEDEPSGPYGLNTDSTWLVMANEAYETKPEWRLNTDIGGTEWVDFNRYPSDWKNRAFKVSGEWLPAKRGKHGATRWSINNQAGRLLVPRAIPPMRLDSIRFASVRNSFHLELSEDVFHHKNRVVIPANTKATVLIDQKVLVNAYPVFAIDKGKDAIVHMAYAEALFDDNGGKGNRNTIDGKHFKGFQDAFVGSGAKEEYMPLWYRTFRYLQLTVETKDEPLIIEDGYALQTEYPFELRAKFTSDDPFLDTLLTVGWRTAKLCAMETYMDCPYYERLQYIGDTRIQGLVSLYNSGDDRLLRQSLWQFDQSRMAEGITLSRYPTNQDQQIPPFSLWWVGMVHDYWMYRNDENFVRELLPGIRQVLSFFKRYQKADGRLGPIPYWNFTDWVDREGWVFGVPPNGTAGNSAILDLQLLWALQLAGTLESEIGVEAIGQEYQQLAAKLKQAIKQVYWSAEKGLFADDKQLTHYSQHANVLAVMAEVVTGSEAQQLMDQVLEDKTLAQTSIYFKYYQFLALKKVGYADRYLEQLDIWKAHVDSGLSTWGEISDANTTRSDCHAWGASPNIELYRMVLGIDSDSPGFSTVNIEPALGALQRAGGTIPHPKGALSVDYQKTGSKWEITVKLPETVSGKLIWKGKSYNLKTGQETHLSI
ncbi:alpha-rhamnosidase [Olivibacter sp. SDN3]|uniref:alpha-L-rhamnosidase-related protein n=1 Tax=Olivibacter sp. SDN3 TaxID=2764720 RepID=UPI0016510DFD|nr:alpha-L-rhamnosidase C-terminal domain-containing protein [Olivibacter sp. SDN3]QNL50466.1 alpha-rhamnosidase [Olivibacter sp. SDN3]